MLKNELHNGELASLYDRILGGMSAKARQIDVQGRQVYIVEKGDGPPLVLIHGTGNSSFFFKPMIDNLENVRAFIPDRPGQGLSDPVDLPREHYREAAVKWVDKLLDTLGLDTTALLGHSMGGLWALWYALAHPDRVDKLVVIGAPQLPGTQAPFPFRMMSTPGIGEMVQRLSTPSPKSVLQFAGFVNEEETLSKYPDLIDLLVALQRDPVSAATDKNEVRAILSPFALFTRSGYRPEITVEPHELRGLTVPTLILWGDNEPVGSIPVIQAINSLIPHSELEILPAGHAPWLGNPARVAELVTAFVQKETL